MSTMPSALHRDKDIQPMTQIDNARLFAALDMLQEQRSKIASKDDALLSARQAEDRMVEKLCDLERAKGMVPDVDAIRAAVRATRQPIGVVYESVGSPSARRLGDWYVNRAKWLPKVYAGMSVACLVIIGIFAFNLMGQMRLERDIAYTQARYVETSSNYDKISGLASNWPAASAMMLPAFHQQLSEGRVRLEEARALVGSKDKQALSARGALAQAARHFDQAEQVHRQAVQLDALAKSSQAWLAATPDAAWPEAAARFTSRQRDLSAALAVGDIDKASQELAAIQGLATAAQSHSQLEEVLATIPPVGQEQARAIVSSAQTALLAGDTTRVAPALSSLQSLSEAINASYTLRIVNEPNEDTGFWRTHDNNPSIRNYYIVVDAIDPAGSRVEIPVLNEETGQYLRASRFGVRVEKSVYESVGADKRDNQLIDEPILGTKKPGVLETQYRAGAGLGVVTRW